MSADALLLASASPRRRELLERVGYAIEVVPADVDETPRPGEAPAAYVVRVARAKALGIARPAGRLVIAADTTVMIDGEILGKAADADEAVAMLRRLIGRTHEVMTAYALASDAGVAVGSCVTEVDFVAGEAAADFTCPRATDRLQHFDLQRRLSAHAVRSCDGPVIALRLEVRHAGFEDAHTT